MQGSVKFIIAGKQPSGGMASGFVSYRVTGRNTIVVYHNQDGKVLFTTPPIPPRA